MKNVEKMSLSVAKQVALDYFKKWLKVTNIEVDKDYLDVNKPELVHFILQSGVVTMLSRRKLNEDGLGKYLVYHPKKSCTFKLKHIIDGI